MMGPTITFDIGNRKKDGRWLLLISRFWYAEFRTVIRICGHNLVGTKLDTHLVKNKAHMELFTIRFEIARWGI
jgi:hypothetical protein